MNTFSRVLLDLITQSPLILIYLAGFIGCLTFWNRNPKAFSFGLAGNAVLLLEVFGRSLSWFILDLVSAQGTTLDPVWFYRGVYFAFNLLGTAGYALVLIALFTGCLGERSGTNNPKPLPGSGLPPLKS
jgi:hypothetical protein